MKNAQWAGAQGGQEGPLVLTEEERAVLNSVDYYLVAGLELKRWWDQASTTNRFAERFELGLTFNRPDTGYGFFDETRVAGSTMPIMGNMQGMLFDRPKIPSQQSMEGAQSMQDQIREYVLHYFMRVSSFRQPQGTMDHERPDLPLYLSPFSLCPPEEPERVGFGFSQIFYKRCDTGQIGRFPEAERFSIIDLREIGQKYEWIVAQVRIYDFSFTYMPFGPTAPYMVLPLSEASYLVLTRDFITNVDRPAPGVLGRYGLGYAFIRNPTPSVQAHGPGEFDAAIELIDFQVYDDGQVRVEMAFVVNRPEKLINFSLNPVNWGITLTNLMSLGLTSRFFASLQGGLKQLPLIGNDIDPVYASAWLANVLTGGQAAEQLCLSRDELDKLILVKHFMQHYQTVVGALHTWRQIPDWLAGEENLPQWVVEGKSS